jgi:hypothetical protein
LKAHFVCVLLVYMRTIRLQTAVAAIFLTFVMVTAHAESPKACPSGEAKRALLEAAHLEDWKGIHGSFKRFRNCDSGKVAEEYSYAVSRLLAHHWDRVDLLLELAADDQGFKQFILRHIDENIPEEETQLIISNSRQRCPVDGEWLCRAIVDY